ncbi:MAG: uroporphyrinogen-III C-methyltransferase [Woeseia sp.]
MARKTTSKRKKKTTATSKEAPKKTSADAAVRPEQPVPAETDEPRADSMPPDTETAAPRGRGRFVGPAAWLALVVSFGALLGAAYILFANLRTGDAVEKSNAALASLNAALDATGESLDGIEHRLDSLATRDVASVADLQALERRLNERVREFESLPGRVVNLEDSVSSLQGISTGARDAWLLAEAEYYMQIANAQLQLAGNPHLASLALRFADERLLQLANPALTGVRRALSDELRAIEGMEDPDIEGLTLTLASLAGVVDSLPLRQEVGVPDKESDEIDPALSGMDRALASLKKTVGGVVSVRRTDETVEPLVAPEAAYFLRANLALQFQTARLALLRNEQQIFEQSLDDASGWLRRYYDADSAAVQSALATIAEIRGGSFSVTPPDISASLRLLRQHVTLSGSTASPAEPE